MADDWIKKLAEENDYSEGHIREAEAREAMRYVTLTDADGEPVVESSEDEFLDWAEDEGLLDDEPESTVEATGDDFPKTPPLR